MRSQGVLILVLFMAHMAAAHANSSFGPLGPFLQQDLGVTLSQLGLLTGIRFLGTMMSSIPSGLFADRLPARHLLTVGQLFFGALLVPLSISGSYVGLLLCMLVIGVGFSVINPTTTRVVMEQFPTNRRATVMALKQMGVPAGGVLAGALLPWLATAFSWQWALLSCGLVLLASAWLAWRGVPAETGAVRPEAKPMAASAFWAELRALLRRKDLLLVSGIQTVFTACQFVLLTYLVLYLVDVHGYTPVAAGFMFGVAQVSGFVFRLLWGLASDLLLGGRRREVVLLIGTCLVVGLLALGWLPAGSPVWLVTVVSVVVGAGGLAWAGVFILIRAELGGKERSAASTGLGMAIGSVGGLLGPPAFGLTVEWTGSYTVAWVIMALLITAGTLSILRVPESSTVEARRAGLGIAGPAGPGQAS